MVTITSLYICISYIYTYLYNFYYLSSLHSNCMSIFSVTYSISLAYLLSIPLLYFYFYTLHISYSFYNLLLFISYHYFSDYVNFYHTFYISLRSVELILYYHIIYCHSFSHILSWLYTIPFVIFYFHVLCSYTVFLLYFSYYFLFYVLYLFIYFSCPVIYFLMIFIYCAFIFFSYTLSRVLDTLLLVLVYLSYYHCIAVLCFSYRVIYSPHFICFMFHACINLRSG